MYSEDHQVHRRRVLAVLAVVAVSALLVWAFSGWNQAGPAPSSPDAATPLSATPLSAAAYSSGPPGTPTTVSPPATTAASGTASAPPGTGQTPITQPAVPETSPPVPTATPIGPCTDPGLDVFARTDAPTYASGHSPRFDLIIVSLDREPCTRDIGRGLRALVVTSLSGTRLWSSTDCSFGTGSDPDPQVLQPNTPVTFSLTWLAHTSQPHCTGPRQTIGPGTYEVTARLGNRYGGGTRFTLAR